MAQPELNGYILVNESFFGMNLTSGVGLVAAFLCSPLASGITGETLHVDKGYHAMGMGADTPLAG